MSEVTQRIVAAYEALGRAVQESLTGNGSEALGGLEREPASVPEEPVFEYRDAEGDRLILGKNQHGAMVVQLVEDMPVHLDQDAVNRLARYLDRHRTDMTDTREPDAPAEHWCGSDSDHAEHVSQAQGVPLRCLGAYAGRYGLSPDDLPSGVNVRGTCRPTANGDGLSSPDCPCTTARYAG